MLVEISEKELILLIALALVVKHFFNKVLGMGVNATLAFILILTHFMKISRGFLGAPIKVIIFWGYKTHFIFFYNFDYFYNL